MYVGVVLTDKTVTEGADMIGVTKQTVQYHLKSLPANCTTKFFIKSA